VGEEVLQLLMDDKQIGVCSHIYKKLEKSWTASFGRAFLSPLTFSPPPLLPFQGLYFLPQGPPQVYPHRDDGICVSQFSVTVTKYLKKISSKGESYFGSGSLFWSFQYMDG
jgi:hypothetical protein